MQNAARKADDDQDPLDDFGGGVDERFATVQSHLDWLARNGYHATVVAVAHDGVDRRTIRGNPNRYPSSAPMIPHVLH